MNGNFQIEFKKMNGNLHVRPRGDFDGSSACQLLNLLHERYEGKGDVIIDTQHLREICPFGCRTFQCRLNRRCLPCDRLFFSGEKGHEIAPEGSMVYESPKKEECRCKGDCANCPCSANKDRN